MSSYHINPRDGFMYPSRPHPQPHGGSAMYILYSESLHKFMAMDGTATTALKYADRFATPAEAELALARHRKTNDEQWHVINIMNPVVNAAERQHLTP